MRGDQPLGLSAADVTRRWRDPTGVVLLWRALGAPTAAPLAAALTSNEERSSSNNVAAKLAVPVVSHFVFSSPSFPSRSSPSLPRPPRHCVPRRSVDKQEVWLAWKSEASIK